MKTNVANLNYTERQIHALIVDRVENAGDNGFGKANWSAFEDDLVMEIGEKFNIDPDTALDYIWKFSGTND